MISDKQHLEKCYKGSRSSSGNARMLIRAGVWVYRPDISCAYQSRLSGRKDLKVYNRLFINEIPINTNIHNSPFEYLKIAMANAVMKRNKPEKLMSEHLLFVCF